MKRSFLSFLDASASPTDNLDERSRKRLFFLNLFMGGLSASILGLLLLWQREPLGGETWLGWGLWQVLVMAAIWRWKQLPGWLVFIHLTLTVAVPFGVSYLLGGFIQTGYAFYAIIAPTLALVLFPRQAAWLVCLYVLAVIAGLGLEPGLTFSKHLPDWLKLLWFGLGALLAGLTGYLAVNFALAQRDRAQRKLKEEQGKTERLLLSIFPEKVAAKVKNSLLDESTVPAIAEYYPNASVLFADMVNFTPMASRMSAAELVSLLNTIFSHFDRLAEKRGLEKIKTVGDCYIVAAGVPQSRTDHAQALADLALEIQSFVKTHRFTAQKVSFRIGINSGPLVAGVIGQRKISYDLWGDTVNIASRMTTHGIGGGIQITQCTYELLKDDFICIPREKIFVKGKGDMEIWLLTGKKDS